MMIERLKLRGCNAYLIEDDAGTFLVDTGIPGNLRNVSKAVKEIDGIIITHAHYDHAGSAYEISEHFSCQIYAHEDDHPYLSGEREFSFRGFVGNLVKRLEKLRKMRNFHPKNVSKLHLQSFDIIHLPGHTPGSIGLMSEKVLICGDVLRAVRKMLFLGKTEVRASSRNFNWNNEVYAKTLYRLSEIDRITVMPGHGDQVDVDGDVIRKLAERMENGVAEIQEKNP